MKKQVIRMTQNGFQKLINESVRRILKEAEKATGVTGYEEDLPDGWTKYTDKNGKTSYFDEDYNEYIKTYTSDGQERLVPVNDFGNTEFRGNKGSIANLYKSTRGNLKLGDFSQLGTKYEPYNVPGVKDREHTNLNDCTDTIRRIYTIKDASKREMALQYLYMDLKDDVLRHGKKIYKAICAEKATSDEIIPNDEVESLILRALNISLGLESGESGRTIAYDPNKTDTNFKTYLSNKIYYTIKNVLSERVKRVFYQIEKSEADNLLINSLSSEERKIIKERIGTFKGKVTRESWNNYKDKVREIANEIWDILSERTYNSFSEIDFDHLYTVFRVSAKTRKSKDVDTSEYYGDTTDGYKYYTVNPKFVDTISIDGDDETTKTITNDISNSETPDYNYDDKTLGIKKQGKSERQYAFESINRIVRKVLTEMRKK